MADREIVSVEEIEAEGGAAFSIHAEPFDELVDEWAVLHAAAAAHGPFQHPAWHRAWMKHFGAGADPVYLAVRHGEQLIGVAALDMRDGVARELGDPDVRDYGGPLAAEGFENDVVLALLDWVAEDMTPELDLWGLRERDPLVALFQAEADVNGWDLDISEEAVAPVTALGEGWEEFLATLSRHDRHELRRKWRHLEAAGDVRYELSNPGDDLEPGLVSLFEMMRASHEGKEDFLTPVIEAFFRDLAAAFAPEATMRLGTLTLDGEAIARLFTFEDGAAVYLYNSGFDPAFEHLAPGLLSKAFAIRDAVERGKRRFEFLRGNEDYKKRLGGKPDRVLRLILKRR